MARRRRKRHQGSTKKQKNDKRKGRGGRAAVAVEMEGASASEEPRGQSYRVRTKGHLRVSPCYRLKELKERRDEMDLH